LDYDQFIMTWVFYPFFGMTHFFMTSNFTCWYSCFQGTNTRLLAFRWWRWNLSILAVHWDSQLKGRILVVVNLRFDWLTRRRYFWPHAISSYGVNHLDMVVVLILWLNICESI